ncbi:hypothetical protein [Streptomyces microflavus]
MSAWENLPPEEYATEVPAQCELARRSMKNARLTGITHHQLSSS